MSADESIHNIASFLTLRAEQVPKEQAIVVCSHAGRHKPRYRALSFAQLEARTNRYANALLGMGIERGTRTLVMLRPDTEFVAVTFALLRIGAVPVLIDPGMGLKPMLCCIQETAPQALIGIPLAHMVRKLKPVTFRTVKHFITAGRRWFWKGQTLKQMRNRGSGDASVVETKPDDVAAILFTSGSTGPAKGVVYEHSMFCAQVRAIRDQYGIEPGDVELGTFPLFALFAPALGMTCVLPQMDVTRPVTVHPRNIIDPINDQQCTEAFGSPALWTRVSQYCVDRNITLPSLKRILISGAPVHWRVIERLKKVLPPSGEVYTPYGATEALPGFSISGSEILGDCLEKSRGGAGTCVGRPFPGMAASVIKITDDPIAIWSDELLVPNGEMGEIVVQGEVVTKSYYGLPHATELAKIRDGDRVWHRMGDIGYFDERGRLWFCGRKSHRVQTASGTMFTVPCEAIFNEHPEVARAALVGVGSPGRQKPVMVVEPDPDEFSTPEKKQTLRDELQSLGRRSPLTERIGTVLLHRSFPVDVRHNAKINREALARWAERQLR